MDAVNHTVTYDITNGCYEDQSVHYVSFDSSNPTAAAIEDVTFAPALGNVPFADCGTNDINQTPAIHCPWMRAREPDRLHQRPDGHRQ